MSDTRIAGRRLPPWAVGLLGAVGVIALWWVLAATVLDGIGAVPDGSGGAIPTPLDVVEQVVADSAANPTFYPRNLGVTLSEAAIGYLWGNGLALGLAALVLLFPLVERVALQLAIISYCIPVVAIGPIIRLVFGTPDSGQPSSTAVFLAALSVFFTTVVGALAGIRSADRTALDVVTVYGGGRVQRLLKVQAVAALPSVLAALQVAAPAAFLGAILGEYLGGVDTGMGVAMTAAQQGYVVPRLWALALVAGLVAGAGYLVLGIVARIVTPWSRGAAGGGS